MSLKQLHFISKLIFEKAAYEDKILTNYKVKNLTELSMQQASDLIEKLRRMPLQEHPVNELCLHTTPPKEL